MDKEIKDNRENAIKITNLKKEYKMYSGRKDRLLEILFPWFQKHKLFTAVDNLNLTIKKGEILGIVGKNGAGKSTLLKMITGVVVPTQGEIEVKGRIGSLLELGIAFNPELTGYENIYEYGQVMGLTNEQIKKKEKEIIDFADIGDHLYQPVKTYSSGMFSRLAFSCAMNGEPDILIVDEVLSVGDMAFQEKSITKMKEIRKKGTTILFVSHSIHAIRNFCDRAIWLKNGKIVMDDNAEEVTEKYKEYMIDAPREKEMKEKIKKSNEERKNKKSKMSIEILDAELSKQEYNIFDDIEMTVKLRNIKKIKKYGVGFIIVDSVGEIVSVINSVRLDQLFDENREIVKLKILKNNYTEGTYYIHISVCDEKVMFSYDKLEYAAKFKINVPKNKFGMEYVDGMCGCQYEIN